MFYLSPDNCGEKFSAILSKISNDIPVGESGYHEMPDGRYFTDMGIRVVSVYGDGLSRDVTEYTGAGAMISDDKNILLFYGIMLADRAITTDDEGKEYAFSDEGETLVSDGAADNHLKAAWYMEFVSAASDTTNQDTTNQDTTNQDTTNQGTTALTVLTPDTGTAITVDETRVNTITTALTSRLGTTVVIEHVAEYPHSTKTINILNSDLRTGEQVAFNVGEVIVEANTLLPFNAKLKNSVAEGWILDWKVLPADRINNSSFQDAEEVGYAAIFYKAGTEEEITEVPEGGNVDVMAYFKNAGTYAPVITAAEPEKKNPGSGPGDSGGCSAFGSLVPAMMLAVLFIARKG